MVRKWCRNVATQAHLDDNAHLYLLTRLTHLATHWDDNYETADSRQAACRACPMNCLSNSSQRHHFRISDTHNILLNSGMRF